MSIVLRFSVVLPAAPYVTDTNVGFSRESSASARPRLRSPSSVRGGKNSNEKEGSAPEPRRSSIRIPGSLRPALRGIAVVGGLAQALEVREPAQGLGEQPRRRVVGEGLAVDR